MSLWVGLVVLGIGTLGGGAAYARFTRGRGEQEKQRHEGVPPMLLADVVARQPCAVVLLSTLTMMLLSVGGLWDIDCGGLRPMVLETDFAEYMKADNAASEGYDIVAAALESSTADGACDAGSEEDDDDDRRLRRQLRKAKGTTETLDLIYAAAPLPGNFLTETSLTEAKAFEARLQAGADWRCHCYPTGSSGTGCDRDCDARKSDLITDFYFVNDVLLDISEVTQWMATQTDCQGFFDIFFNSENLGSNISVSSFRVRLSTCLPSPPGATARVVAFLPPPSPDATVI